jgi:hypothetical protein
MSYTSKAGSVFLMDDPGDGENKKGAVQLKSGCGNFTFAWDGEDSGGVTIETKAGKQKIKMDAAGDITITSKDGAITVTAKKDLTFKAEGDIKMEGKSVSIEAKSGDLTLKGVNVTGTGQQGFSFKDSAGSQVTAAPTGLTLKGTLVQIN